MFSDPTFWVLVAFSLFIIVLAKPAFGIITTGLDKRADKIRNDIAEAEALLKEAQDLLATYQKKQRDAAKEAEDIAARAKTDAERLAEQGRELLAAALARREKSAEDRIRQAEAAAIEQIRITTIDIALEAARSLLADKLSASKANELVDDAIGELPAKLH
jgi:F-type H+-transporting ATPase subunit b